MPDYLCARKTWKPVIAPVGIDLSRLSLNDKVQIEVPYSLVNDGEGTSWSVCCGGNSTPTMQGAPSLATLSVYTVTFFPFLIADVGDWSFSIWQIGPSITTPKNNIIEIKVYCDSELSVECLKPVFANNLSN
jgi:hypothetical protein